MGNFLDYIEIPCDGKALTKLSLYKHLDKKSIVATVNKFLFLVL